MMYFLNYWETKFER